MQPSVGRIVHYLVPANETTSGKPEVVAGIITKVAGSLVDLTLFPNQRQQMFASNVAEGEVEGRWSWPPRV